MGKEIKNGVTFVLREPTSKSEQPISLIQRFNNDRIKISTGVKVLPKYWDPQKCRVRNIVAAADKDKINALLSDIEKRAKRLFVDLQTSQALTKENLKAGLLEIVRPAPPQPAPVESALFSFIREFIKTSPERINPATGKKISGRTIQKYETVFTVLQEFAKEYHRKLDFETIDLEFYDRFTEYLTHKKKLDKDGNVVDAGFSANNVGKYVQTLKTFLNEATAKKINVKTEYQSRRFKVYKEPADNVYLTESELQTILDLDLSEDSRLERVRDLFIVGCWTGFRFSDMVNLHADNIGSDNYIRIEQYKTGAGGKVVIPCHPSIKVVLNRYGGNLPPAISNQKMNDYIKEVCQLAGINEKVSKSITKGGERITNMHKKWELVSTHTARRSFATNAYKKGIPSITIMKITGHRSEKHFLNYIKLSQEEHARIIDQAWKDEQKPFFEVARNG